MENDGDPDAVCLVVEISNAPLDLLDLLIDAAPDLKPAAVLPGHALANIQARLRALSGSRARVEVLVSRERCAARARLIIPDPGAVANRRSCVVPVGPELVGTGK